MVRNQSWNSDWVCVRRHRSYLLIPKNSSIWKKQLVGMVSHRTNSGNLQGFSLPDIGLEHDQNGFVRTRVPAQRHADHESGRSPPHNARFQMTTASLYSQNTF